MERKVVVYGNELYHYGVPGQKWGVRNYQNEDGSYKPGAEGRYYDPVGVTANRFSKTGGLSVQSRHEIAKRRNEQKFKDASTGKKIVRAALAATSFGTQKWASRFQYRHQVGLNKLNKAAGVLGGLSVAGGAILTATGNPMGALLIKSGVTSIGSAVVNRYINMPLNDAIYENVYSGHNKTIYKEREKAANYENEKNEAYDKYDKKIEQIESKYSKSSDTLSKKDQEAERKAQQDYDEELRKLKEKYGM